MFTYYTNDIQFRDLIPTEWTQHVYCKDDLL